MSNARLRRLTAQAAVVAIGAVVAGCSTTTGVPPVAGVQFVASA